MIHETEWNCSAFSCHIYQMNEAALPVNMGVVFDENWANVIKVGLFKRPGLSRLTHW
jgi:hypothetical protein